LAKIYTQGRFKFGWTVEQVKAAQGNYLDSPFQDKDKALLGLVLKAVRNSNSVNAEDIASVRTHGWSDGDIFDAVTYGAKMVSTDILINAFKVEPE
jgi:alkylhydroperoxidase family enzyme